MKKLFLKIIIILFFIINSTTISLAQSSQTDEVDGIYCPKLTTLLRLGYRDKNTGNQVSELQQFIIDYYNLDANKLIISGIFGRLTRGYVVQFQKEQNLIQTGIVGAVTRAKIASICTDHSDSLNTTVNTNFSSSTSAALQCPLLNIPTCNGTLLPSIVKGCTQYTCTANQATATTT